MVKIIIDTDGVADDIRAISLALHHPECEVLAITTVHGCVSVEQATANVVRTLKANEKEIPVYKGSAKPLLGSGSSTISYFFGTDGIGDLPENYPKVEPSDFDAHENGAAAIALIKLTKDHPDATLVCLGPLTNIAVAMRLDCNFKKQVLRMVMMGGNYLGVGNVLHSSAEYNFHTDPEAAHIVLKEMTCPITLIPWELYYLEGPKNATLVDFDGHLKYDSTLAGYLYTVTSKCREFRAKSNGQLMYCDEIAVAVAIDSQRIAKETKKLRVEVELYGKRTRGQVMVDWLPAAAAEEQNDSNQNGATKSGEFRNVTFVTSYDVVLLNQWMHATTSGKWSTD